jgi:hypothetical protein
MGPHQPNLLARRQAVRGQLHGSWAMLWFAERIGWVQRQPEDRDRSGVRRGYQGWNSRSSIFYSCQSLAIIISSFKHNQTILATECQLNTKQGPLQKALLALRERVELHYSYIVRPAGRWCRGFPLRLASRGLRRAGVLKKNLQSDYGNSRLDAIVV